MSNDDCDLQEYFAAVRQEDEAQVPPISTLLATAREPCRRWMPGKLIAGATCLAMLIAAAIWLLHGSRSVHEGSNRGREQAAASITAASITSWKPATDFLLDTPGREMLEGVPDIGEWRGVVNAPGRGESHRRFKQPILR